MPDTRSGGPALDSNERTQVSGRDNVRRKRLLGTGAVALAAAMAVAGCGGSSGSKSSTDSKGSGGVKTVSLGLIPIVDVAPVYLGANKGFFKDQGIDLKLSSGQGGAAIVPGVASGSLNFGFGNNTSTIIAASKGLPLKVVASGVYNTGKSDADYVEVMVGKNSPLKSAAELAGKTVAVNTLQNIGDTTVRASVRKAGGDPSKVKFVEMPFPNMNAALAKGQVDAIWQVEPFVALAKREGDRVLAHPLTDTTQDLMVSTFFTTQQYAAQNPDVVKKFKAAIDKSLTYAQDHPDEVRAIIPTYLTVPKDLVSELVLPRWTPDISRPTFDVLIQQAESDGLIKSKPDTKALLGS